MVDALFVLNASDDMKAEATRLLEMYLDDLIEMKNMPKVTRCVAMLAKMVRPYQHLPHTRRG